MKRIKNTLGYAAMGIILAACATAPTTTTTQPSIAPIPQAQTHFEINPILADQTPAPATKPSDLPPGHPALPAAPQAALPPGHPALPAGQPALPSGHPAIPSGQGALPPGHPKLANAGPTAAPSTQPAGAGVLNIHAVQKTVGAAAVGADSVVIELYFKDQLLDQTTAKLTADGSLKVAGLPVAMGIQPLVKITHAGVVYATIGDVMDAQHPELSLDVPVFETVEKAPDWSLTMRHVIVHPSATGLDVMEMLAIQMPGDRSWIGTADAAGKRTTLSVPLPAGAKDIKIGGSLGADAVTFENGILKSSQAIFPGEDRYQLEYTIPNTDNKATVAVTAPANMGHVMVFVPDDGTTVTPNAPLKLMGTQQMDDKGPKTRYFMATQITAGQTLTLTISDLSSAHVIDTTSTPAEGAQASVPAPASKAPRLVATIGGGSILALGAILLLAKSPKNAAAKKK